MRIRTDRELPQGTAIVLDRDGHEVGRFALPLNGEPPPDGADVLVLPPDDATHYFPQYFPKPFNPFRIFGWRW